jgi:hypothetical protein
MLGWLGQLAYGSALALGSHFLIVGIRIKPLRGQAWLGLILAGAAKASLLAGGRGSISGPLSIGLAAGAASGSVLLSHRFLALHTADRRAMRALARAYADLQSSARMRELGVSAASISHEIRDYAAALKGNASLLDRMWDGAGRPAEAGALRRGEMGGGPGRVLICDEAPHISRFLAVCANVGIIPAVRASRDAGAGYALQGRFALIDAALGPATSLPASRKRFRLAGDPPRESAAGGGTFPEPAWLSEESLVAAALPAPLAGVA